MQICCCLFLNEIKRICLLLFCNCFQNGKYLLVSEYVQCNKERAGKVGVPANNNKKQETWLISGSFGKKSEIIFIQTADSERGRKAKEWKRTYII